MGEALGLAKIPRQGILLAVQSHHPRLLVTHSRPVVGRIEVQPDDIAQFLE